MAATPRNSRRGWKISGRARIRSLDRSTRATFQLLFVSGIGERIMHLTLIPIIQILEGENEYANERILIKISESRRNGLLIKFRKCRARGIQRGSELIDMHDVGAKDPTLPCSSPFFVRSPRTREKNAPSRGKQFLGRGMGWMERWRCTSSHVLRRGNLLPRLGGSR